MKGLRLVLHCLLLLLTPMMPTQGQTVSTTPSAPKPVTMAEALAQAIPPASGLTLAVGADTLTLPDGEAPPPPNLPIIQIAQGFGQETRRFGTVTAIGPPTMTVLNEHPSGGDPLADMNGFVAIKMLMASLSDTQWNALTSENGLGFSNLTSETQQSFFRALFKHGQLIVCPTPAPGKPQDKDSIRDLTDEIPQTRVRLSQSVRLQIPTQDSENFGISNLYQSAVPGAAKYQLYQGKLPPKTTIDGVQVSAEIPNTPKHGQLDLTAPVFQAPVPLSGLKTVNDVITRIGQQTHLEMYADAHYADRALTLMGPAQTASASDLLQAIGWSLTATWRKVGPAYVLTDDVTGVGTRREILSQYHTMMEAAREPLINTAGDINFTKHSARSLPTLGDPLAATPEQLAPDKGVGLFLPELPAWPQNVPLSSLTAAQQEAAHKIADAYQQNEAAQIAKAPNAAPDLTGNIQLEPSSKLEAIVPMLDGTVDLQPHSIPLAMLFWPGDDITKTRTKAYEAEAEKQAETTKPVLPKRPLPTLTETMMATPQHALLAAPQTPQDVDALIQEMSKIGLNELWLIVFTRGHSRLAESGSDILTEAIKEGRKAKIAIYPVIDLFDWEPAIAGADADLNLLGQTSEQIEAEQMAQLIAKLQSQGKSDDLSLVVPTHLDAVSPFAPSVQAKLVQMIHSLAARTGIAGLIWQDTTNDGYDLGMNDDSGDPANLGYTEPARLAFLRKFHSDPVDISPSYFNADGTHLPRFDNSAVEATLNTKWRTFRKQQELTLLQALAATAQSAHLLSILIKSRRASDTDGWFGSWDGPRAPIPTYRTPPWDDEGNPLSWVDLDKQAKQQSRTALVLVTRPPIPDSKSLAAVLDDACHDKSWNGFVLDDTEDKDQTWLKSLAAQYKP